MLTTQEVAHGLGVHLDDVSLYARRQHHLRDGEWSLADARKARSHFLGSAGTCSLDAILRGPEFAPSPEEDYEPEAAEPDAESTE